MPGVGIGPLAVLAFRDEGHCRLAVLRALRNVPKDRRHVWDLCWNDPSMLPGSLDGSDSIEIALVLGNRALFPEALDWIESEMKVMQAMEKPDGRIEDWQGEGDFHLTALIQALVTSQGVRPETWVPVSSSIPTAAGGR